jgi:hypothetical protein
MNLDLMEGLMNHMDFDVQKSLMFDNSVNGIEKIIED